MGSSLLAPTYTLTLGQQRFAEQALALDLRLAAAPVIDSLTATLPAAVKLSASPGDPAALTLGSGEKEAAVFSGTVDSVRRSFDGVRVTALDAGAALARLRPAATYEKVTAGTVIRRLADTAGADVGAVDDGVDLAFYVADPGRTALDHVARLAAWSGALARVSAAGALEARVVDASRAEVALRFGREVLALDDATVRSTVTSWVVAGEGGAGTTAAPAALRPVTDFFAGQRPDGPSLDSRWRFAPALRTPRGAATAGAALARSYRSSRERGRLSAFLQPDLRPGTIIEVHDLPDGLPGGPLWLHHVRHRLDGTGAFTRASFWKGGDSFDPLALLGALAGALGSLL
jgi:hypothetical protein